MADVTVDDILKRHAALKLDRKPFEAYWQDVNDYIMPRSSFWDLDGSDNGKRPRIRLYDATGLNEALLLADGIVGNLVSSHLHWLRLTMEDPRQNDIPWAKDWLEELEETLYAAFARSTFYDAIGQFFIDGVTIGTPVMLAEDDIREKNVLYSTRHIKECWIAEGRDGRADTLFREFPLANRQWPMFFDNLSKQRKEQVREQPYAMGRVIHAVYPRADRDPTKRDSGNMGWASCYIDKAYHNGEFLDEGGYEMFPYLVWRWRKNTDERYGRSPGMDAIDTVMLANQKAKTALEVGQLAAQPPLNVPKEMRGTEKIVPRGYNYYTDPQKMIFPIPLGQNYNVSKDQQQEVREEIRAIFRTKMYVLMEQLKDKGPYTATEIHERQGEAATIQGPLISRLNADVLIPAIRRQYMVLERNGMIPPPPPGLEQGGRVRIEFQGPLAVKTRKYHENQGIDTSVELIERMAQMFPESLDNVDADELIRIGMDAKGSPQKTIREKPQVTELRKIRQQQQEEQQKQAIAMEQQKMLAGNANKLNEPMKEDSMLAGIAQGAASAAGQGGPQQR